MTVRLFNAAGTQLAVGTKTAATGTNAVTTAASYNASNVASSTVRFTWPARTTWSYTAPPTAPTSCIGVDASGVPTGASCTISVTSYASWQPGGGQWQGNYYYSGSTAAPYAIVVVRFDQYLAFTPTGVNRQIAGTTLAPGYSCSSLPTFRVKVPVQNYNNGNSFWGGFDLYTNPAAQNGTSLCP
jgi:hypothetical protein